MFFVLSGKNERDDKKYKYVIDENRNIIIGKDKYIGIREMSTGFFVENFNQKTGVLSFDGKTIVPCIYDSVENVLSEGATGDYFLVSIKINDKEINYGAISMTGENILNCVWRAIAKTYFGFITIDEFKKNHYFYM